MWKSLSSYEAQSCHHTDPVEMDVLSLDLIKRQLRSRNGEPKKYLFKKGRIHSGIYNLNWFTSISFGR